MPPWNLQLRDQIMALNAEKLTNQQIADRLGLTKGQVNGHVYKAKVNAGILAKPIPGAREAARRPTTGRFSEKTAGLPNTDPRRADKLLRRFSWQDGEE